MDRLKRKEGDVIVMPDLSHAPQGIVVNEKLSLTRITFNKFILLVIVFFSLTAPVSAVEESYGPNRYGWNQVYDQSAGTWSRLTGAADREFYDYGYKPIQIYARIEDYWSKDCGWWYISDTETVDITLLDALGNTFNSSTSQGTQKGRVELTYDWAGDTDSVPGRWNVSVTDSTPAANTVKFYLYVRGQLNVTSITTSPSNPDKGTTATISATVKDHRSRLINGSANDNAGTDVTPTNVTAYVTGSGEFFEVLLRDDGVAPDTGTDGIWMGDFTPQVPGDHKIIVKVSDGHNYWVDGRGSTWTYVGGAFPFASLGLSFIDLTRGIGAVREIFGSASFFGDIIDGLSLHSRIHETFLAIFSVFGIAFLLRRR